MGFTHWLRSLFGDEATEVTAEEFWGLASKMYIRELAFSACVSIYANALSKCEILTYKNGVSVKSDEYYSWNVEPNINQSSSVFLNKLMWKLMQNNEVLIIEPIPGKRLVADSFNLETYALLPYKFTGVTVDGFTFNKTFYQPDVMYIKLAHHDIKPLLDQLQNDYGQLVEYAKQSYKKSRGLKATLTSDKTTTSKDKDPNKEVDMLTKQLESFLKADSSILPLRKDQTFAAVDRKNTDTTRDIRAMMDDIFTFYARGFHIAPALILGDVQDTGKAVDEFLTFGLDPLLDKIGEEGNRKIYGKRVLAGDYMRFNSQTIKHIDLFDVATSSDKLVSSGLYSINDIRIATGSDRINEAWADEHWMTKNYQKMIDAMNALMGKE